MNKHKILNKLRRMAYVLAVPTVISVASCTENIDESNLYTFKGELISTYLEHRPDSFSNFSYIVKRAGMEPILSAYGRYTCFAPLNDAVQHYVDSLYDDMSNPGLPHNGMTARSLEGLTDSLCVDIATFHLTNSKLLGVDMSGDPINTMLGRTITASIDSVTGNTTLNVNAQITSLDNEVENGVVHVINQVISRSNLLLASQMERQKNLSVFNEALKLTGLADSLTLTEKNNVGEVPNNLGFYVPKKAGIGFTVFAETNDALRQAGINSISDLKAYADRVYGNAAQWYDYVRNNNIQISTGTDYSNPWNTLNMFVRYHILKSNLPYSRLVINKNQIEGMPLYEYRETMLPYTLLKITGSKADDARYLNLAVRNGSLTNTVASTSDGTGGFGTDDMHEVVRPGIEINKLQGDQPLNGSIHPISGMLIYDAVVPQVVLRERLRFDVGALLMELDNSNLRLRKETDITAMNGGKNGKDGVSNKNGFVRFPPQFFDNLRFYNGVNTRLYYLPGGSTGYLNYQRDEFMALGPFDFALRLPPVPDGTYELRLGFHGNFLRTIVQFFLGENTNEPMKMTALDIPLDMRLVLKPLEDGTPDPTTGWFDWKKVREGDAGVASDRNMHNLGWLRGPLYFSLNGQFTGTTGRDEGGAHPSLRRIITRKVFKQGEYWLRFKTALPANTETEFQLDYIELVPSSVYSNSTYLEDMY